MAVENTPAQAPAAEPVAAPVNSSPAATESTQVAAPAEVKVESAPAAVEAAVEQPKAEVAPESKATTVLGTEPPKESKPSSQEAAKSAPEATKEEGKQSAEPAPLPSYEAWKLPEGVKFDDAKLNDFTKTIGEFQAVTKADQAAVQAFGQKLVDMHTADMQNVVKSMNDHYKKTLETQKTDWKEQFVKDPEIGGNRQETTVKSALEFIRTHGGNETQQKEFRDLMESTGLGNHPAMIRMLANAARNMSEGKPLPATKPTPTAAKQWDKRYGGTQ